MAGIRDTVGRQSGRAPLVTRRSLLVGATAAGGLALAWSVWPRDYRPNLTAAADEHIFNAFLKIGDDGHVSTIVPQCEMGQGVTTLLPQIIARSEEHTSELQSLMRISYAVFCLKK